jgi:ectoine hydroxylase-related dioxygenase (phytanoyl-CoA dioxygenase family)
VTDPADVDAFRRDGVVCLRGVLSPEQVALAAAGIDAVLAAPSRLGLRASRGGDGAFVEDFRNWQHVPQIAELARTGPFGRIAAELTGSERVRLHHDHVLVKEAGTSQRTPWHQDQPYYDIDGSMTASFWIPVDPVPLASTLEFVAGSHLGPWLLPRTFMDHQAKWFPEGSLVELPDIEADRTAFRIVAWPLEPGDVVCFHMLTVHGAGGFAGPGRRRVLSLRYVGDDAVHRRRPWRTSPPFDDLDGGPDDGPDDGLVDGAPYDHPAFPVVWPA